MWWTAAIKFALLAEAAVVFNEAAGSKPKDPKRPVNILMILADDLGYGDTSVRPFEGSGIATPELEKMAARGAIMTNFHTAAATCTPTRSSILTGMYPWRSGIKAVYEYGSPTSNRNDWLPLLPTSAMAFRDANYKTGHSGKWHLGGMRNDDLDMRYTPAEYLSKRNSTMRRCPHPGPNQQGFDEYVSVLDGPGAPRQNDLQTKSILYSQGCTALLRNDVHIGRLNGSDTETLSDCEARHAIRMMKESVQSKTPFFIHLWFHAPHGPWEKLPGFEKLYPDLSNAQNDKLPFCASNHGALYCKSTDEKRVERANREVMVKYQTMVSAMDRSIGMVLSSLKAMGIEEDTLVIFTSDNGPEKMTPGDPAGTAGGFRGMKRNIYEGGIRVPAIWQWIGTIPMGSTIPNFGITTDLFPTFLDAAGLKPPSTVKLDGKSLLPLLVSNTKMKKRKRKNGKKKLSERIAMWHNDWEGPRSSAIWIYDFKIFLDEKEEPKEMFDMTIDLKEKNNLIDPINKVALPFTKEKMVYFATNFTKNIYDQKVRSNPELHWWILGQTFPLLHDFAKYGNEAHVLYLKGNEGRTYVPTVESDIRTTVQNPYKFISKDKSIKMRENLLFNGTCGRTVCSCDQSTAEATPSLPFDLVSQGQQKGLRLNLTQGRGHRWVTPDNVPEASVLLLPNSESKLNLN